MLTFAVQRFMSVIVSPTRPILYGFAIALRATHRQSPPNACQIFNFFEMPRRFDGKVLGVLLGGPQNMGAVGGAADEV
jgi:hypothetical protein